MRSMIGGLAAALAGLALSSSAAGAAAWCLWYNAYTYNCGFYTFESCLYTARPEGAFCSPNVYPDSDPPVLPHHHKKVRHEL